VSESRRLFTCAGRSLSSVCLTLYAGVTCNQRHSVDVTSYALQGSASSGGGGQTFGVVNGDSSQHGSGSTTPLAFDYETRSYTQHH